MLPIIWVKLPNVANLAVVHVSHNVAWSRLLSTVAARQWEGSVCRHRTCNVGGIMLVQVRPFNWADSERAQTPRFRILIIMCNYACFRDTRFQMGCTIRGRKGSFMPQLCQQQQSILPAARQWLLESISETKSVTIQSYCVFIVWPTDGDEKFVDM